MVHIFFWSRFATKFLIKASAQAYLSFLIAIFSNSNLYFYQMFKMYKLKMPWWGSQFVLLHEASFGKTYFSKLSSAISEVYESGIGRLEMHWRILIAENVICIISSCSKRRTGFQNIINVYLFSCVDSCASFANYLTIFKYIHFKNLDNKYQRKSQKSRQLSHR